MSDDREYFDEELDDPFELLALFGWHASEQDDDDGDEQDEDEWDDDVYWANASIFESAMGGWGEFVHGLAWDGSRDLRNDPQSDDLSLYDHVRLVMDTRRAERIHAHLS